jgi:hypothetical protein
MSFVPLLLDYWPGMLCATGIGAILYRWTRIRGTTLVAPMFWTVASLVIVAIAAGGDPAANGENARRATDYFVGVSMLCPAMALFGAKRPQDSAWQFIVFTLWIVLSLPAIHWWLAGGGGAFNIHIAQSWFIFLLWLMIAVNHLFTRFALASVLISLAQWTLLQQFMPTANWLPRLSLHVGLLLGLGVVIALLVTFWRRTAAQPLDRVWLDFRDCFGAVWGLRVQQRVNQSASMCGWNLRLNWNGFRTIEENPISPDEFVAVKNNLNNLLRRFVSTEWIEKRLAPEHRISETKT